MHPTSFEHRVNAWTAVDLAMVQENLLDFGCKLGIFSAMLAHRAVFPGIIAALGNLQCLAEQRDRIFVAVLCHELKLHSWLREKMPIASDRISPNLLIFY